MLAKWQGMLDHIQSQLEENHYGRARDYCSSLTQEILDNVGPGGTIDRTLGLISASHAIAEIGLGNRDDGLWYWRTAETLFPEIDTTDLPSYGGITQRLKAEPFRASFPNATLVTAATHEGVIAPVLRHHTKPHYPKGMAKAGIQGRYEVEVVVDIDGHVKEPRMVTKLLDASLAYAVLDAVRQWEYEPGLLDGKPAFFLQRNIIAYKIDE